MGGSDGIERNREQAKAKTDRGWQSVRADCPVVMEIASSGWG
ncbi:MAG: hypothetical protein ACRCTP_23190 [Aeromonas popoffii]